VPYMVIDDDEGKVTAIKEPIQLTWLAACLTVDIPYCNIPFQSFQALTHHE